MAETPNERIPRLCDYATVTPDRTHGPAVKNVRGYVICASCIAAMRDAEDSWEKAQHAANHPPVRLPAVDATTAAPPVWLIEKPEPGGVYWWRGTIDERDVIDGFIRDREVTDRQTWPAYFTRDANAAVPFRSRRDAESVMRLLPKNWGEIFVATEHVFLRAAASPVVEASEKLNDPNAWPVGLLDIRGHDDPQFPPPAPNKLKR